MKTLSMTRATMADFDEIRRDVEAFWGCEDKTLWTEQRKQRILSLHHAMYVHEFGDTSYVIKDNDRVAAYLFGFLVESRRLAYSSLVAVRDSYKNQGLGERLYKAFAEYARARGCVVMRAVTVSGNVRSIAFHTRRLGMTMQGKGRQNGVPVVQDYAGIGEHRVVFEKALS
jgi:GNAT superfamily N-acetyltransferase